MATASLLTALGVVAAPFLWFPVLTTKAYPGQHMVNAIAGVLLGPWWAALVALAVGLIRMSLGIGTVYSIPGGVPGALVVGLTAWLLRRRGARPELAALAEPLGTVLVGGTLALYLFAPAVGDVRMLARLEAGHLAALLGLWGGWALSSVPGSLIGFLALLALGRGRD